MKREGENGTGLSYYQDEQWLSAIKKYGENIMNKSLLSTEQKLRLALVAENRRGEILKSK
jgi:hypothetical protein